MLILCNSDNNKVAGFIIAVLGRKKKKNRVLILGYSPMGHPNFYTVRPKLLSVSELMLYNMFLNCWKLYYLSFHYIGQMPIKGDFSNIWEESFW